MRYGFNDRMAISTGEQEKHDIAFLRHNISGCIDVRKTDPETDRIGIDYICTLRKGAVIYVDAKTRQKGASKYWKYGEPELALEVWSVKPENGSSGKVGWTLNEASPVHKILYTFDPSDSEYYYLLDFQNLRMALCKHYKEWVKKYGLKEETSTSEQKQWSSVSIFVPASVVMEAMHEFECGRECAVRGRFRIHMRSRVVHFGVFRGAVRLINRLRKKA